MAKPTYSHFIKLKTNTPKFDFDHTKPLDKQAQTWLDYVCNISPDMQYEPYFDLMIWNTIHILENENKPAIDAWIKLQDHIFPDTKLTNSLDLRKYPSCLADALNIIARMYLNYFEKPLDILIEGVAPGIESNYAAFIGAPYLNSPVTPGMDAIYKCNTLNALLQASHTNTHNQIMSCKWSTEQLNNLENMPANNTDARTRMLHYYNPESISKLITTNEYITNLFKHELESLYPLSPGEKETEPFKYYMFFLSSFNPELNMSDEDLISTYILLKYEHELWITIRKHFFNLIEDNSSEIKYWASVENLMQKLQYKCEVLPIYRAITLFDDINDVSSCIKNLKLIKQYYALATDIKPMLLPEL